MDATIEHFKLQAEQDAKAKEEIGYAQMNNNERKVFDKLDLAFKKHRDEEDDKFNI